MSNETGNTDSQKPTGARVEISADGSGIRAFDADGTLVMYSGLTPDDAVPDEVTHPDNERD